jgi:hypothetical protein
VLCAAFTLLVSAAPAGAFDIPSFTVSPSTTQAGGHPDLTVQIARTGADDEDIRDLYLDLPPGLIGNTTTVGACSDANFNADTCPANSQVGTVSAIAEATGLELPPTTGTIYNLEPGPTEPGAIGIVLRPTGAPLAISPVFIRGSIEVAQPGFAVASNDADVNLKNVVLNQPRQVFLLGMIPVDITVNQLTLTLNAAGTLAPNTWFLTNPTSCGEATSKARVVSYLDQEVNVTSSFEPTNCEAVPFDPFFAVDFNPSTVGAHTQPITSAGTPADNNPLSQSNVKTTQVVFPYGQIAVDFYEAAFGLPFCNDAQIMNDTCGPGAQIGTLEATVPVVDPPTFTGKLYRSLHYDLGLLTVTAVLQGPRGIRSYVNGIGTFPPEGVAFTFPTQPQVPITDLTLELTRKIYVNLPSCGSKRIDAHLTGWSGATRDVSDTYKTTGGGCEYARPKAATPTTVALVPAFKQCTSGNATHGAPLAVPSCSPPDMSSDYLTIGTPDTNGQPPNFSGNVTLKTVGESPIDPDNGDQADVQLSAHLSDVRNASDLSDYTGELRAVLPLRITDRYSGEYLDSAATTADSPFGFNIDCTATAGPAGSDCNVATSADAVMTDVVKEGQRAVWRLDKVQVFDGGADGDADTEGDNTLFAVQGAFAP